MIKANTENGKTKSERIQEGFEIWVAYWRANPHRFAKECLGLNLKPFQQFLLVAMNISNYFMFIAARGLGK